MKEGKVKMVFWNINGLILLKKITDIFLKEYNIGISLNLSLTLILFYLANDSPLILSYPLSSPWDFRSHLPDLYELPTHKLKNRRRLVLQIPITYLS